LITRFTKDFDA
jgi:hypothetical protein